MFKTHLSFSVCFANIAVFCSHWAQEAWLCYKELMPRRHFKAFCFLCCHQSFIMHRYVLYIYFLACCGRPGLSGQVRLAGIKLPGALRSKQRIAWPCSAPRSMLRQTSGDAHSPAHSCMHPQLTQLFPALRHNTVKPWLSFRHRACCRVIALLINVSPSQDNGLVFTVRFSRLAMRDIQWCNLLSVHYALRGTPLGTLFLGSSQVTHLSMYCFSLVHKEIDLNHKCYSVTTQCGPISSSLKNCSAIGDYDGLYLYTVCWCQNITPSL